MRGIVWLLLAVAPSAWLAWNWRSMPQLGFYHDDALYWVSAQSLAQTGSYRIASLPTQPFQTKYPPLFPLLLSAVWKLNPGFPANLPAAVLLVWCVFPVYLWLLWLLLRRYGLRTWECALLTGLAAINPMAVLLSMSLMPELLFTSLLLAAVLVRRPAISGALAGLAFLTKAAALPLILAIPIAFALRKQYRQALTFFAAALPLAAAWQWWAFRHASPGRDLVSMYYTSYLRFQFFNVPLTDVPLVAWHNLDSLLMSIGKLLTFDTASFESRHVERIVAVAAIAGVVRLARATAQYRYPLTALLFAVLLLFWHYQPDQRFVFPLYPLLLLGLWTELKNVALALRLAWARGPADQAVAAPAAALLGSFLLFVIGSSLFGVFGFLPRLLNAYRDDLNGRLAAYSWIRGQAAPSAAVFAYDDPILYLYTGRPSCNLPVPTKLFYHRDEAGIDRLIDEVPRFARAQHLSYALLTPGDFYRDLHELRARRLATVVGKDAAAAQVYRSPQASIYALH